MQKYLLKQISGIIKKDHFLINVIYSIKTPSAIFLWIQNRRVQESIKYRTTLYI